jgi:DNA-binding beta-propeller fold protein YncE
MIRSKVISRLHHIVATSRAGPHPKNIVVSADGTRVYVTGYDGSTSIISTADNTVKPFSWTGVPLKSSARTETTSSGVSCI